MKRALLCTVLCLSLSASSYATAPDSCGVWYGKADWSRPYDGDTVYIGGINVRIWGLDAEEWNTRAGHLAKGALRWIIDRHTVRCYSAGYKSHNRTVAECHMIDLHEGEREATDIALVMISRGYALDCERYSGGYYAYFESKGARKVLTPAPYCHGESDWPGRSPSKFASDCLKK